MKPIQTWQVINENSLEVLETTNREPVDIFNNMLLLFLGNILMKGDI
jgi:hypothetical protein